LDILANSPLITALISDGATVFAGNAREARRPLWSAPVSEPTAWTNAPEEVCRGAVCRGPNTFAYDPERRLIYAANWAAGLWRYAIP
jgi:hypothetical protein